MVLLAGLMGLIFVILGLGVYVLMAYGLYVMAQKRSIENPWIAFIPVAQFYILGKLIVSLKIANYDIPSIEIVLPVASIATFVLSGIPVLGWLLSLAFIVLFLFALYKLYSMYAPSNATLYTVLSIIPVCAAIFIFIIKDNQPVNVQ